MATKNISRLSFDWGPFVLEKSQLFSDAPQESQEPQELKEPFRPSQNRNGLCAPPFSRSLHCPPLSRKILDHPLTTFIEAALKHVRDSSATRWSADDDSWRSPAFDFARLCKAHRDLAELSSTEALASVEQALREQPDLPKEIEPWSHFFPENEDGEILDRDDLTLDFVHSWDNVRHVPFHDILEKAYQMSSQNPPLRAHPLGNLYARFAGLAICLQRLRPGDTIFLPTRSVAELLGCDHKAVSRMRRIALRDGLMEEVSPHRYSPGGGGKATEFRVNPDSL